MPTEVEQATADIIENGQWNGEWQEEYIRHRIIKAVSAVVVRLSRESQRWTKRCDDAKRIPDWLWDQSQDIK